MKTKLSPREQAIADMKKCHVNTNVLNKQKEILAISQLLTIIDLNILIQASI